MIYTNGIVNLYCVRKSTKLTVIIMVYIIKNNNFK